MGNRILNNIDIPVDAIADGAKKTALEMWTTINAMPIMDLARLLLVAVCLYIGVKIAAKAVKAVLFVFAAFVIVTKFL